VLHIPILLGEKDAGSNYNVSVMAITLDWIKNGKK
jgi:hypothetical protein